MQYYYVIAISNSIFYKFKALKNTFNQVKILLFFHSQLTGLIQNKAKYYNIISKHFTEPMVYTRTTSGAIFSADVWIKGGEVFLIL